MVVSCQGRFNTLLGCQDWPGSTGTSQLSVKEVLAGHLQMCFLEFPCSPFLGGGGGRETSSPLWQSGSSKSQVTWIKALGRGVVGDNHERKERGPEKH